MENENTFQFISMLAMTLEKNPRLLGMAKQQPTFPEIERKVIIMIADADSLSNARAAYDSYRGLVPEWKFVFASDKGSAPGLSANRNFSDGSVVRGLFSKECVLMLDAKTRNEMRSHREVNFPIDYSIALDTQALSYLAPYVEGNTSKLPKDFHEIFSFISRENVYVDPIPYIIENLPNILEEKNVAAIRKKLGGYEILKTIDVAHFQETGEIRSRLSKSERDNSVDITVKKMMADASNEEYMASSSYRRTLLYCALLKMTTIQLRAPQQSLAIKLREFLDFLDSKLQTIFARETVVAAEYFTKGQKLAFFSEIHKSPADRLPKMIAKLKNMAWDFWHIRYIEGAVTIDGEVSTECKPRARYFFPSLLTCDKGFIELIDLYPLKSYAYTPASSELLLFAEMDWIKKIAATKDAEAELRGKHFSQAAVNRREMRRRGAEAEIHAITQELEAEFSKVAVNR